MSTHFGEQSMEQRLTLATVAQELHADGRLGAADLARVGRSALVKVHPLVFLAEQKLADQAAPGKLLDMDRLLAWLSGKAGRSWSMASTRAD